MKKPLDPDEIELFRQAMKQVKKLPAPKTIEQKAPRVRLKIRSPEIETTAQNRIYISREKLETPPKFLLWAKSGMQVRQMRQLKRGESPIQGRLDLHGMTLDQAERALMRLIDAAIENQWRAVCVVHGKGQRKMDKFPLLKAFVDAYLRQEPRVIAFCSAQPRDGGEGAVYVLLERQ
jgi:DNA-nicking Smr family endonuclease